MLIQLTAHKWLNPDHIAYVTWDKTGLLVGLAVTGYGSPAFDAQAPYELRLSPNESTALLSFLQAHGQMLFCQPVDVYDDDAQDVLQPGDGSGDDIAF